MIEQLRTSASVVDNGNAVIIDFLDSRYRLTDDTADVFRALQSHIGQVHDTQTLADVAGIPAKRVDDLFALLRKAGLLQPPSVTIEDVTGEEFYRLHRRYATAWLRPIYEHSLWDKIVSGRATRAQVIGFAMEKYHYIEAAHEHMSIAAANATPVMMPHLARHFIEEYTHGDIYRHGLRALFTDEQILNCLPLPTTRALVNCLNELAARNSFSYYAANEVLQMTENSDHEQGGSQNVSEFYTQMERHYPFSKPLIDAFIQHTNLDQKLKHNDVFHEMCVDTKRLTTEQVNDAMQAAKQITEQLMIFLDGIELMYGSECNPLRMPSTLLSD